jgi:hypothetical protein
METINKARWQLDRHINVGHLLTTIALMAGLFLWGSRMEQRIAVLEDRYNRQDAATAEAFRELKIELREMSRKLDRWQEREGKR